MTWLLLTLLAFTLPPIPRRPPSFRVAHVAPAKGDPLSHWRRVRR